MQILQSKILFYFFALALLGASSTVLAADAKGRMNFTTKSEKARAHFEQGLAKYDRARLKEATALFQQSIEADPNFAMAQLFRGLAGDSSSHIRKAAELAGNVTESERLLILSWNAQLESQTLKAVEYMEQAVKALPQEARLRVRLAQLYSATGRRDDAVAELKRAIDNDPKFAGSETKWKGHRVDEIELL